MTNWMYFSEMAGEGKCVFQLDIALHATIIYGLAINQSEALQ